MDTCALVCTRYMHKDCYETVHSGQLHLVHSDRMQNTMFLHTVAIIYYPLFWNIISCTLSHIVTDNRQKWPEIVKGRLTERLLAPTKWNKLWIRCQKEPQCKISCCRV